MSIICGNCGTLDSNKRSSKGEDKLLLFIIWLVLIKFSNDVSTEFGVLVFFFGILILAIVKPKKYFDVCKTCGAENSFVETDTPKGKQLHEQYHYKKSVSPEK